MNLHAQNELGDTPLHGAMFGNKPKIVQMLIDAGQSVQPGLFDLGQFGTYPEGRSWVGSGALGFIQG